MAPKVEQNKVKKSKFKLNKQVEESLPLQAGPKYSLIKEIEKSPYYGKAVTRNDNRATAFIEEHVETGASGKIVLVNLYYSSISNQKPGRNLNIMILILA